MRKVSIFLVCLLVLGAVFASAQPVEGKKFEAGTAIEYNGINVGGNNAGCYLYIPLRFGWYVWKGLEVEPELALNIPLKYGYDMTCIGTLNVFYNYKLGKKFVPFAGGGLSIGNAYPLAQYPMGEQSGYASLNTAAMNLGGGLKYLLTDSVALRAEYRCSLYRLTQDGSDGHENMTFHKVMIGLSYIF